MNYKHNYQGSYRSMHNTVLMVVFDR